MRNILCVEWECDFRHEIFGPHCCGIVRVELPDRAEGLVTAFLYPGKEGVVGEAERLVRTDVREAGEGATRRTGAIRSAQVAGHGRERRAGVDGDPILRLAELIDREHRCRGVTDPTRPQLVRT